MDKEFNIFAGVDGAGKTTLYFKQLETEKNKYFGLRVNIDEIVQAIGDWKNPKDQIRASKIALKIRNEYLENGYSFNQETTLCGKSIISFIRKAKDKGYKINLYYVGLESEQIAKDRVKIRVSKGGHGIAPELIERRYKESLENLKAILPIVNNLYLFDNTKEFKRIENNGKNTSTSELGLFGSEFNTRIISENNGQLGEQQLNSNSLQFGDTREMDKGIFSNQNSDGLSRTSNSNEIAGTDGAGDIREQYSEQDERRWSNRYGDVRRERDRPIQILQRDNDLKIDFKSNNEIIITSAKDK